MTNTTTRESRNHSNERKKMVKKLSKERKISNRIMKKLIILEKIKENNIISTKLPLSQALVIDFWLKLC